MVINLTNPRSHFEISKASLMAGKHVYSEKPLATDFLHAAELVDLAEKHHLSISSAPCNVLGASAQTAWKALREDIIGKVHLVYANLDDGMIHQHHYKNWISPSGAHWPYKDEFEVGCTLEHAGYLVSWLITFFGSVHSITSFASCQIVDKKTDVLLEINTPDLSIGTLKFNSGVVARVTSSIIAPRDHSLHVFGDRGTLSVGDCWNYDAPVFIKRRLKYAAAEKYQILNSLPGLAVKKYPLVKGGEFKYRYKGIHQMDFSRGITELAASIREERPSRLSSHFSLHVNEIVLTLQYPEQMGSPRLLTSTFEPPVPMPWAK
jgi:predicted dehydrogenase